MVGVVVWFVWFLCCPSPQGFVLSVSETLAGFEGDGQQQKGEASVEHFPTGGKLWELAAMPHIAPVILKRRGGFSGTSKRPPLCALGPETAMGTHCHFRV